MKTRDLARDLNLADMDTCFAPRTTLVLFDDTNIADLVCVSCVINRFFDNGGNKVIEIEGSNN